MVYYCTKASKDFFPLIFYTFTTTINTKNLIT
jgi:hypothetical protein